jgi:hypothetical protein
MRAWLRAGASRQRERTRRLERMAPHMAPRGRRTAALMLAACALACIGSGARANPAPTAIVYTHIHGGQSVFCNTLPVSACEEIVQVVDATGVLNFDMILAWGGDLDFLYAWATNLEFTVRWPEEWQFVDASACGSGALGVVHEGNGATFIIESLEGAPVNGQVLGLGRLVLNVTSEGSTSCPDWPGHAGTVWIGGRISECGDCMEAICGVDWEPVRPALPSPLLELAAGDSGMAVEQFHVDSDGLEHGTPISYAFSATVPWITLETALSGDPTYPDYDVTVTADARTLEPGVHEAWIEVQSETCYECEKIVFTVPETDPPAADPETWGSMKTKFR